MNEIRNPKQKEMLNQVQKHDIKGRLLFLSSRNCFGISVFGEISLG